MTKPTGVGRGGARDGSGRKPSGRVQYVTRLRPDNVEWIKDQAASQECAEADIVEEAIDRRRKQKK
jgi:hypothetical protein